MSLISEHVNIMLTELMVSHLLGCYIEKIPNERERDKSI